MKLLNQRPAAVMPIAGFPDVFAHALVVAVLFSGSAQAADSSCAVVTKAATKGLAHTRIHQAVFMPFGSTKTTATANDIGHFIVVDKTRYTSIMKGVFEAAPIVTDADRVSGIYYVLLLSEMDGDCRALGTTTLAGRRALVFENGSNKKIDESLIKVWIDSSTGLLLRADMDEPTPEVTNFGVTKDRKPNIEVKKTAKRMVNSVAFLFGDAVKAPTMDAKKKTLFGTPGSLDPQATAELVALLN